MQSNHSPHGPNHDPLFAVVSLQTASSKNNSQCFFVCVLNIYVFTFYTEIRCVEFIQLLK